MSSTTEYAAALAQSLASRASAAERADVLRALVRRRLNGARREWHRWTRRALLHRSRRATRESSEIPASSYKD